ncbi:MAG TPA: glycosyltransferase family 4 protein [Polyangiaceae bacterium]
MRVVALNQFYLPDSAPTGQLLGELCEDLAAQGDDVTVITGSGTYLDKKHLAHRETIRGVRVLRLWGPSAGGTMVHRSAAYLTFWTSAAARAATVARPDVMLSLTTPPMLSTGAASVAGARRIPLVTWNQDVYPELSAALGVLDEQALAYKALQGVARWAHAHTKRIVALSEGMAERIASQGAPAERISVIPNWADGRAIRPLLPDANPFRKEHALEGRFIVMYSGNLGLAHDVTTFAGTARQLSESSNKVLFIFSGHGQRMQEARRLTVGLPNVRFLPLQPRERLCESLSAADVHLVSLREGLQGLLVPSKVYGALASGRPVFYVGPAHCEVAELIRRERVGWEGRPGDEHGLAEAIRQALESPSEHQAMSHRARDLFERRFDRQHATRRWREVLEQAASASAAGFG